MGKTFDARVQIANPELAAISRTLGANVAQQYMGVQFKSATADYFNSGNDAGYRNLITRTCKTHSECPSVAKERWDADSYWNDFSVEGCGDDILEADYGDEEDVDCTKDQLIALGLKPY